MNLLGNIKITRVLSAQAASGNDTLSSSVVDMSGFDGVLFLPLLGAVGNNAVPTLRAQSGALANGTDMANMAGNAAATAGASNGNGVLALDLFRPIARYVRAELDRGGTGNITVDGMLAVQYSGKRQPAVQDSSVLATALVISADAS